MTTVAHRLGSDNRSQRFGHGREGTNENMSPDLPEKVLGIDLEDTEESQPEDDEEEQVRFVIVTVGEHRLAVPVDAVKTTTAVPSDLTDVPRSPEGVVGVTDLRGAITAVVELRVYFPTEGRPEGPRQLLVLDRPDDDQSAALRVDTVEDIENVPESDVYHENDIDHAKVRTMDVPDNVFDHPLVRALVISEERVDVDVEDVISTENADGPSFESRAVDSEEASPLEITGRDGAFDDAEAGPADERSKSGDVEVETTPLLDVEGLLLVAGQTDREEDDVATIP